jgi:hypothetical protein
MLLLSVFVLPGCTFAVPQAESAMRWVKSLSQDQEDDPKQAPSWLATVDGYGAVLKPYTSGDFIVFANAKGDAITFDGWIVRSITGFGLSQPLSVSGKEGERSFVSESTVSKARCGSWVWRSPVWRQWCDQGSSEIVLDEDGNIQEISMSLGKKLRFVTLRVAN